MIRAHTGSIANVLEGAHLGNIKVGQIFVLSQNGSWALVDAHISVFLNLSQFDLFFLKEMIKIGFFPTFVHFEGTLALWNMFIFYLLNFETFSM